MEAGLISYLDEGVSDPRFMDKHISLGPMDARELHYIISNTNNTFCPNESYYFREEIAREGVLIRF